VEEGKGAKKGVQICSLNAASCLSWNAPIVETIKSVPIIAMGNTIMSTVPAITQKSVAIITVSAR